MIRIIITIAILAAAYVSHAQETLVRVGIQNAIQPFVLPEEDSGLLVEVIREAFAKEAIKVQFTYLTTGQLQGAYKRNLVDMITNAKPDAGLTASLSRFPMVQFHNQAITLKAKHPHLSNVAALENLQVVAFLGAQHFLGDEFAKMATKNNHYIEAKNMPSSILLRNQADVVISQPDIFRYWFLHDSYMTVKNDLLDQFAYHDIFEKMNAYWFAYRNDKLRDSFERGIEAIYNDGTIDKLYDEYNKKYGVSRDMFIELDCRFLKQNRPTNCL